MIKRQFMGIWNDLKYSFLDLWNTIHHFLNKFFDDQFLGILGIALLAILAVTLFVKFSTK